jgi:hypothetical protein
MNTAISKTNTINRGAGRAFYMLAALAALAFLLYLLFIGQTVFKLVAEKNVTAQVRTLSAEISQLELEALSLNDTISIERAYELGFVNAIKTQYVATTGELSLR